MHRGRQSARMEAPHGIGPALDRADVEAPNGIQWRRSSEVMPFAHKQNNLTDCWQTWWNV